MDRYRLILVAVLALASGACAMVRSPDGPEVGRALPGREVVVENWTGTDLRIYAVYAGEVTMLGRVGAVGTTVVRLSDAAGGVVRLFTRPIGIFEVEHLSEPVQIPFGNRVTWQLQATGGTAIRYLPPVVTGNERAGPRGL